MNITQASVARSRERLLVDFYRHKGWPIPGGFIGPDEHFGSVARRMMRRANLELAIHPAGSLKNDTWTRELTQAMERAIRPELTPLDVAHRFLGAIEVGNNEGRLVELVQDHARPAVRRAPYCAAGVGYCYDVAGWPEWGTFADRELDAWVPEWVECARLRKYGLSIVSPANAAPNDAVAFDWSGQGGPAGVFDHIGLVRTRVIGNNVGTREFNTGPGPGGNQSDGDGCWDRVRPVGPGVVFIRCNTGTWR